MYCPKCGKETADGSIFCQACGEKLISSNELIINREEDSAVIGFVLGILSFFLSWTLIIPIFGLVFSNKGMKSKKRSLAFAGKVLSIVALSSWIIIGSIFLFLTGSIAISNEISKKNTETKTEMTPNIIKKNLNWHTTLGIIETKTNDKVPKKVLINMIVGYNENEIKTGQSITSMKDEIIQKVKNHINEKKAIELKSEDEVLLKVELKKLINAIIFPNEIQEILLQQLEVGE